MRDIAGIWDAGGAGIGGPGYESPPWPTGRSRRRAPSPGNGPRAVYKNEHQRSALDGLRSDRLPAVVLYETRLFQIVQTPNQVLILYMLSDAGVI
jgi:hypothetical protein